VVFSESNINAQKNQLNFSPHFYLFTYKMDISETFQTNFFDSFLRFSHLAKIRTGVHLKDVPVGTYFVAKHENP
jgi:hypothetical protein